MVYVLNQNKKPLMPTKDHRKVRLLLRQNKATVVTLTPFTIMLLHNVHAYKQEITLGVDAGSKHIGASASTESQELYSAEVELRKDIVDLLSTRREQRRTRRNRLRYRKPRFLNRTKSKKKGWLAPSVQHKVNLHLKVVADIHKLLPVARIIVETASFDIQKIKNPTIQGEDYQRGEQLDFWNVREYVLFRDGHVCQHCKGKSKDKILNVHHIESRKTGGDAPNNLVTLCETCHTAYHKGKIDLKIKRGRSFRDAAFMGIMRWSFYGKLRTMYPHVSMTYGYITKNTRIQHGLPKEHFVDAFCIAGNMQAESLNHFYYQKKVRCHNRQIHKANILKGGRKKLNQSPKYVFGYQLFDNVLCNGKTGFIFGRRTSGYFDVRTLNGTKISAAINYKKLRLLEKRNNLLIERRAVSSP